MKITLYFKVIFKCAVKEKHILFLPGRSAEINDCTRMNTIQASTKTNTSGVEKVLSGLFGIAVFGSRFYQLVLELRKRLWCFSAVAFPVSTTPPENRGRQVNCHPISTAIEMKNSL